jgi:hypothetical protein
MVSCRCAFGICQQALAVEVLDRQRSRSMISARLLVSLRWGRKLKWRKNPMQWTIIIYGANLLLLLILALPLPPTAPRQAVHVDHLAIYNKTHKPKECIFFCAPKECIALCEHFGGVKTYNAPRVNFVVHYRDTMFFPEDAPEKCEKHGGVMYRTSLGSPYCICADGSSGWGIP